MSREFYIIRKHGKHPHPLELQKEKYPIFQYVGNTPMIKLNYLPFVNTKSAIYAKLEKFNFGGSIKDRPALWMIREAEHHGELNKDDTIIEPTSGNTGIGLAWIGKIKGYKVTLVVPDSVSAERKAILRSYGAELIQTSGEKGIDGSIEYAKRLAKEKDDYIMLDQYSNQANVESHMQTTGPEIWHQTNKKVDYLITGVGTSGTITGVGTYLRTKNPNLEIIGVQPTTDRSIPGLKNMQVNKKPKIYNEDLLDDIIYVSYTDAIDMVRTLASKGSLLVGPSSGAALHAVCMYIKQHRPELKDKRIVTIFPDGGLRYLSLGIF